MRARRELLSALAVDLLDEVLIFGLAIVRRLDLRLPVELDEEIAASDARARLHEVDDDERTRAGAGETGNDHRVAADRLDETVKPEGRCIVLAPNGYTGSRDGERDDDRRQSA